MMLKEKNGLTLIEALIGVFLFLVFFLGIFGVIQLGIRVASGEQNKVAATAIVNGEMERIKNLSYSLIGIAGGFPSGILESQKTKTVSNRDYIVKTSVDYVIDLKDGVADPEDECPNDYKKVEVEVSWSNPFSGSVIMSTNIAPSTLSEECGETGGVLYASVFDSLGSVVDSPLIEIKDPETFEVIKTATPYNGEHYFSLPTGIYKVTASKDGYSSESTYGSGEVAIPEKPNLQVFENKATESSFYIDKVASFSVSTLLPWVISNFSDSFNDESKLSDIVNITLEGSMAKLMPEQVSGYLVSIPISPQSLLRWNEFSWNDEISENAIIKYQVFYKPGENWVLVPESDLPGNSFGFTEAPIDLSSLNIQTYDELELMAIFSTNDIQISPSLLSWFVSWRSSGGTPISNISFNLSGLKTIGKDRDENDVYKYSKSHNSGSSGSIDIEDLEWDDYNFSIETQGLSLESIEPALQPIHLDPDTHGSVNLYLEAQNSLSVTAKDSESETPIFSAGIRIFNGQYDETKYTDIKGQVFFAPLSAGSYTIEAQAEGYNPYTESKYVSGGSTQVIQLQQDD